MEQLPAPCSTVGGKRQEALGGTKLSASKGRVAHASQLSKAPAFANKVAVISRGPGWCRAEWEGSYQHAWEGAMLVP